MEWQWTVDKYNNEMREKETNKYHKIESLCLFVVCF